MIDLNNLERLARNAYLADERSIGFAPGTVLDLIGLARAAADTIKLRQDLEASEEARSLAEQKISALTRAGLMPADSLPKIKEGAALPEPWQNRLRLCPASSDVAVAMEAEITELRARLAAPASQAAAPADDDLLEVARCLCSMAARRAELSPEKRKHYPRVDEEGSPLLDAARAACVARGYTEDGLAVEGVEYPAGAAPVEAAKPEPLLTLQGTMIEVGNMESGRGFSVEIETDSYIDLTGLTEEETREAANLYAKAVRIEVFAAPAPEAQ